MGAYSRGGRLFEGRALIRWGAYLRWCLIEALRYKEKKDNLLLFYTMEGHSGWRGPLPHLSPKLALFVVVGGTLYCT